VGSSPTSTAIGYKKQLYNIKNMVVKEILDRIKKTYYNNPEEFDLVESCLIDLNNEELDLICDVMEEKDYLSTKDFEEFAEFLGWYFEEIQKLTLPIEDIELLDRSYLEISVGFGIAKLVKYGFVELHEKVGREWSYKLTTKGSKNIKNELDSIH
jgi:hypothetical protein